MTVGERIKAARNKAGLKQSELAEKLGVAVITIGQYERDKRQPRLEQLRRIAAALGVEWTDLVDSDTAATMTIDHVMSKLKALSTPLERVTRDMSQMTEEGQSKVADYAADILPRYRAETAPQSTPPAPGDTDTPTPQNPAEEPQKPEEDS